jgi:hypothetical protein
MRNHLPAKNPRLWRLQTRTNRLTSVVVLSLLTLVRSKCRLVTHMGKVGIRTLTCIRWIQS